MKIGDSIKLHREELGMSAVDLADDLEMNRSTICEWENNKKFPKWDNILKLVDCIGIDFLRDALEGRL